MRKPLKSLIAATFTAGSLGILISSPWTFGQADDRSSSAGSSVHSQENMPAGQSNVQIPPGIQPGQATDTQGIQTTLAKITDSAASKSGLDNVVSYFVEADRNRLSDQAKKLADEATLNGRIAELQKDWKNKYNQNFSVNPQVAFGKQFEGFSIVEGKVTNPMMLSNWPVSSQGAAQAGQQGEPGQGGKSNIQQGQQVAIVTLPASHGLPEVTASMVKEGNQWRLDIPDNIDAQRLHDNLLTQLTSLDEQKDQWPNDVNEASRLATHRVLVGIYGISTSQGGQPQRMMIQPQGQQEQLGQPQQGQQEQQPQRQE